MTATLLLLGLVGLQSTSHPGFAHNDYVHSRPLLEAWENGFRYVEADVFLVDGKILVAHDLKDVKADRTLTSMYLEPLSKLPLRKRSTSPFWLMVDIKANGAAVYSALEKELAKFQSMLVKWTDAGPSSGRVAIVLSGDRPVAQVASQKERWVAIDGRPEDLEKNPSIGLVPWISTSYLGFKWPPGVGKIENWNAALKEYVDKAHGQRRKVRFWAIPDSPASWKMQLDLGIDMINTDKPKEFVKWFELVKPSGSRNRSLVR
ncbi:MAG: hypothetical protein H7Y17_09605 [Chlorobia bacterium]|nr:hypothetical protein [Fimbriimonadaceae bacterium]